MGEKCFKKPEPFSNLLRTTRNKELIHALLYDLR